MKAFIIIPLIFASVPLTTSFMTWKQFTDGKLSRCYIDRGDKGIYSEIVNGQKQPLPSSMETFISLVERLEDAYPTIQATEMIRRLLVSFRIDGVPEDYRTWDSRNRDLNSIECEIFGIRNVNYAWKDEDISEDEQCALHFMLSHAINDTLDGRENEESIDGGSLSKHPREYGLVSLHAKEKHALALSKVLLGIYAGLSGKKEIQASEILRNLRRNEDSGLAGVQVRPLVATTIADLISVFISDKTFKRGEVAFMPNGKWNDLTCTTEYTLEDNNKRFLTNSLVRGAIDGLLIGKKLEEDPAKFGQQKLSQILRMYYGPTGIFDANKVDLRSDMQWCKRVDNLRLYTSLKDEVLNYYKLYTSFSGSSVTDTSDSEISEVLGYIQGSTQIFNEVADEATECSRRDATLDKCLTPSDIFAVLDWQTTDTIKDFQIDVLAQLSTSLEVRPKGNSVGAYTNLSPMQNKGLHTIANNSGIAGCSSCFARYFKRIGSSKQGEVEVFNNLNETLTEFVQYQDTVEQHDGNLKYVKPAKVVLLFNFGNPVDDQRLRDAVWEFKKNFREVTVLAIGPKKENLQMLTENDDTDIFQESGNSGALGLVTKLKTRICKVPAEFQFKECHRSNRGTESDNKHVGYIPVNKKQYLAMYPKYFLKSFSITMKVKALDGAQIKVCYARSYYRILEDNQVHKTCKESSDEAVFTESNPCKRRNEHNCDPFYFSIEGVKPASSDCSSIHCRTPKDIIYEFSHEGISCNSASFLSSSMLVILVCSVFMYLKRH